MAKTEPNDQRFLGMKRSSGPLVRRSSERFGGLSLETGYKDQKKGSKSQSQHVSKQEPSKLNGRLPFLGP